MMVLDGMQPLFRHVPPNRLRSMSATFAPRLTAVCAAIKPAARPDPANARRAAAAKRAETAPLRKRVSEAEVKLAQLTRQLNKLDTTLADGGLFARDPARAAELSKTRANVVAAIAKAEEEWLAASAALETT